MKLLNELYTIMRETHEDGAHDYLLRLNAGHFIYAAHFPGEPITPGVCILQIAHELLQLALKKPLKIICVKNVKFMKLVSPDQIREIHYSISKISESVNAEGDGKNVVRAQITVSDNDGAEYAKLSLMMQPEPI
jgi:3-hydroxyacyl-[acyl-carrier-protein] dehydratase